MDILFTALLGTAAFISGAVPFSMIIARWALNKDVTQYGDGNPGAVNVFRAGGQKAGALALVLDIGKGVPFVLLSHTVLTLPDVSVVFIALCAVLGHAFSPFLHWRGGKAIAVTFGVMIGLPNYEVLLAFIAFTLIGFFIIEVDAWKIIFGATGAMVYLAVTKGSSWEPLLVLLILTVLVIKHFDALHTLPRFRGLLYRWVQSIIRTTMYII